MKRRWRVFSPFFSCKKNLDVQNFLLKNSIPYEKAHNARTYLLVDEKQNIVAFYSLAIRTIPSDNLELTDSKKKKAKGYGNSSSKLITGFLIGQLARNDNCIKEDLSGDEILESAISKLIQIQKTIGGRLIYVDCVDELLKFYQDNGFFKVAKKSGLNILVKYL